ncbi:MAG: hypothetical protein ACXVEE_20895, partial [Polyangiales bacterium]
GIVLLGFDHEAAPMTPYARKDRSLWPGLLDGFPEKELGYALGEPAFDADTITFAIWRDQGRSRVGQEALRARAARSRHRQKALERGRLRGDRGERARDGVSARALISDRRRPSRASPARSPTRA